ncbi:MAG TPA: hypothetical protein VMR00_03340 [Streptosporangiaceae bacterium]|nr:hypothetical protein [Streptosporangiaceae bacterium]
MRLPADSAPGTQPGACTAQPGTSAASRPAAPGGPRPGVPALMQARRLIAAGHAAAIRHPALR